MMKTIRITLYLSLLLNFFSGEILAQPVWKKLQTENIVDPFSENYIGVLSTSADRRTVYAGIDSGIIQFDGYAWKRLGNISTSNGEKRVTSITCDEASNIYVAGTFTNASSHYYVAKWTGTSWVELGALNPNNGITSLACDNNGNLYAAGYFTNGSGFHYVAKWNGSSWSELGSLLANNDIKAMCFDAGGNLYVAGNFTNAGGYRYVAKWNGSSWAEAGPGLLNADGTIMSMSADTLGNVYAAGAFTNTSSLKYVAKWNGLSWTELGTGVNALNPNGYIYTIKTDPAGNVCAAGGFRNNFGYYVAKWNGNTWTEVSGVNRLNAHDIINSLAIDAGGKIYATGSFKNNDDFTYIAAFDSVTNKWDTTGNVLRNNLSGMGDVQNIVIGKKGHVFTYSCLNTYTGTSVWEWNGLAWLAVGVDYEFPTAGIHCVTSLSIDSTLDNIYASGQFLSVNDSTSVARWNGVKWECIAKTSIENGLIRGVLIDKDGNLYSGGERQSDGHRFVRKWDGNSWTRIGDSTNLPENYSLLMDHHGHIYVYGYRDFEFVPTIMKLNGSSWDTLPPQFNIFVYDIFGFTFDYNDNLYIGHADNGLAEVWKYDGTSWSIVGDPDYFDVSHSNIVVACDRKNNLYATGNSSSGYNAIHKWDGVSWRPVGISSINWDPVFDDVFHVTYDDQQETLYATGDLSYNQPARFFAYYSGLDLLCPPAASTNLGSDITGNNYQWQLNTGNGFTNIVNNSFYSGANTESLQINNIPSSSYNNEYRCIVDGRPGFTFKLQFANTWLANSGTAWENPANWSCGVIPDANTDVFFYGGHAIINNSTSIRSLSTQGNNTSIQLNTGVTLTVTH